MELWTEIRKGADFAGLAAKFGIDQVTARLIRNRDVIEEEEFRKYLHGGLSDLHSPELMKDAGTLVDILSQKIAEKKHIRIIGDYDIDGVMSTYILKKALTDCGAVVSFSIPDRIKDGYGLNINLIEQAISDEVDTIITCDNGIAAIDEIAYAKENGMTVLVTDHHAVPFDEVDGVKKYKVSKADAIVNPHQQECKYPFKDLCGAAVAWKMICLLYDKMGFSEEKKWEFLEFVAFATVGDIMDLKGENRILVKEGIKRIHKTENIGMKALIMQCGLKPEDIECYHFGFVLGPCINATGRLDTAIRAIEMLLTDDTNVATPLANDLVLLNEERKEMTIKGVEQSKEIYEKEGYDKDPVVVIYMPEVHESIAGIIAGKIREAYNKPTFILTRGKNIVKGSGRSIEEYSMYEEMCKCQDLLDKFGGHPMAAGLSLKEENVDAFRKKINELCELTEKDLARKIKIDVAMPVDYVSMDLVREFDILAPFGKANSKPVFADRNLKIERMWVIGKNANVLRFTMRNDKGCPISAIYFGDIDMLFEYLTEKFGIDQVEKAKNGKDNNIRVSMVYAPKINNYRDMESLQFEIQSIK